MLTYLLFNEYLILRYGRTELLVTLIRIFQCPQLTFLTTRDLIRFLNFGSVDAAGPTVLPILVLVCRYT